MQLIFSSFFNGKARLADTFKRLCKFMRMNPNASRYLAMYSKPYLKLEKAVDFICTVLKILKNIVGPKIKAAANDYKESEENETQHKPRTIENVLASVENVSLDGKLPCNP